MSAGSRGTFSIARGGPGRVGQGQAGGSQHRLRDVSRQVAPMVQADL